jgi:two-component system OmpR family sensor kinase
MKYQVKHVTNTLLSAGMWVKRHARLHTLVAVAVFGIGLGATIYYWNNLRQSVEADMDNAFDRRSQAIGNAAMARMQLYENFLRGSAGLFVVYDYLPQQDWDEYHRPYDIRDKYPDIEGIGLSRYLTRDQLPDFVEWKNTHEEGTYKIFPAGDRDVYVAVSLNAPFTGNNGKAKGFDGYTDPTRRAAMIKALETGRPAVSGKLTLVSESRKDRSSFILYMPIYKRGQPITTVAERRAAITGFTYMAIDANAFVDAVLASAQGTHLALRLSDPLSTDKNQVLYESPDFESVAQQEGSRSEKQTVEAYGHRWEMELAASPDIISSYERQLPGQAVWRGIVSSLFFAGLVWYLITDRERKYARQKQEEVQTAKDDLLSLASHQLRTPATVVKQYVGMLLQGYAGDLTKQQLAMLSDAYDSNERQLEIINQLLYVARLDAGRIVLRQERTDLSKLLRDVARDQSEAVAARNQQLQFKIPKRPVWAEVDSHYMRMVFENLLSNAIKYTPEQGKLTMNIRRTPGQVIIKLADTGVGIEPDLQDTIFDKFTRVENSLSTDVNGSGVGLYLTRQIVELHGGTIEVRSVPGQGSTFIVRIPSHAPKGHPGA